MTSIQLFIRGPAIDYPFEIEDLVVEIGIPTIVLNLELTLKASIFGSEVN